MAVSQALIVVLVHTSMHIYFNLWKPVLVLRGAGYEVQIEWSNQSPYR